MSTQGISQTLNTSIKDLAMNYRDALWSAIIGEADRFGHRITKAKRARYMKLTVYWSRATK